MEDPVSDNSVAEKDIGDLDRRNLRSRYFSCEITIPFGDDEHKLIAEPSPGEWSE